MTDLPAHAARLDAAACQFAELVCQETTPVKWRGGASVLHQVSPRPPPAAPSRLGQSLVIHTNKARSLPRKAQPVRCTPHGNIDLMAKKKVLDFKPARGLEQVGDQGPKQVEDGKHRVG